MSGPNRGHRASFCIVGICLLVVGRVASASPLPRLDALQVRVVSASASVGRVLIVAVLRNDSDRPVELDQIRLNQLSGSSSSTFVGSWTVSVDALVPLYLNLPGHEARPKVITDTAQGAQRVEEAGPGRVGPHSELLVVLTSDSRTVVFSPGRDQIQPALTSDTQGNASTSFALRGVAKLPSLLLDLGSGTSQVGGNANARLPETDGDVIIRRWTGSSWRKVRTVSRSWFDRYREHPSETLPSGLYLFQLDVNDPHGQLVFAGVPL